MTSKHIALFAAALALGCSSSGGGSGGSSGGGSGGSSGGGSGGADAATGGGGGSTGGSAGTSGAAGAGSCTPACEFGRDCCGGECTNLANDPRNCGACETKCLDDEWCNGSGKCEKQPCTTTCSDPKLCCGGACCGAGEICCDLQGPTSTGPECTKPDPRGTCPVGCSPKCACASPDTLIATPEGQRPIVDLKAGDLVHSVHRGQLTVVPLLKTQRVPVQNHEVVQLSFVGGARIEMTAGHPTADGRSFGDLQAGQGVDGVTLQSVRVIPYQHEATYDILPQSDTGAYFASGILVGSTMRPRGESALASAGHAPRCSASLR